MFNLIGRAQAIDFPNFEDLMFTSGALTLSDVISNIATWIIFLAGTIAVIYLVYGGILYITAGGDAEKATKGRTAIINAVIGIVIILIALLITLWVKGILEAGSA